MNVIKNCYLISDKIKGLKDKSYKIYLLLIDNL